MKTWMKWASVAGVGALIFSGVTISRGNMAGSPHNFSARSWNTTSEFICEVCHWPHNKPSTPQLIPLWGHQTSSDSGYQMYTSATFQGSATIASAPSGVSKACLSCHDGSVSIDSFGSAIADPGTEKLQSGDTGFLDKDLRNDHPISFTYDNDLADDDGYLHRPTEQTVPKVGGKTIAEALLVGGKLECSSCHDVHGTKGDSGGNSLLLIINGKQSELCLTCHNK